MGNYKYTEEQRDKFIKKWIELGKPPIYRFTRNNNIRASTFRNWLKVIKLLPSQNIAIPQVKNRDWAKVIENFKKSGMDITNFCAQEKIPVSSMHYNLKKARKTEVRAKKTKNTYQQVSLDDLIEQPKQEKGGIEADFNGLKIKASAEQLAEIIKQLNK